MVSAATRARPGEGGPTGDVPQVTWESSGAEERRTEVKILNDELCMVTNPSNLQAKDGIACDTHEVTCTSLY